MSVPAPDAGKVGERIRVIDEAGWDEAAIAAGAKAKKCVPPLAGMRNLAILGRGPSSRSDSVKRTVNTELNTTLLAVLIFNSRLEPSWQRKGRRRTWHRSGI